MDILKEYHSCSGVLRTLVACSSINPPTKMAAASLGTAPDATHCASAPSTPQRERKNQTNAQLFAGGALVRRLASWEPSPFLS
ncbi:Protein of unknown function [Gryllus bimaculatus]|nr:Protein of unknown function [Gryllus bimaculatus]